jgi:hypothetical protein
MSAILFFGAQVLSVVAAGAVLFEYRRICRNRTMLFERLGSAATGRRAQIALASLYILSTVLLITAATYVFLLQSTPA